MKAKNEENETVSERSERSERRDWSRLKGFRITSHGFRMNYSKLDNFRAISLDGISLTQSDREMILSSQAVVVFQLTQIRCAWVCMCAYKSFFPKKEIRIHSMWTKLNRESHGYSLENTPPEMIRVPIVSVLCCVDGDCYRYEWIYSVTNVLRILSLPLRSI